MAAGRIIFAPHDWSGVSMQQFHQQFSIADVLRAVGILVGRSSDYMHAASGSGAQNASPESLGRGDGHKLGLGQNGGDYRRATFATALRIWLSGKLETC